MAPSPTYARMRAALEQIANQAEDGRISELAQTALGRRGARRKGDDNRQAQALELRAEGKSLREMARIMGLSRPTVRNCLMARIAFLRERPDHPQYPLLGRVQDMEKATESYRAKDDIETCLAALEMRCNSASPREIADRFGLPDQYRGAMHQYANSLVSRALTFLKNNPEHPKRHLFDQYLTRHSAK